MADQHVMHGKHAIGAPGHETENHFAAIRKHEGVEAERRKKNEPGAHLADGRPVILAEIGNRLVIGNKAAGQPHHFNIATSLTLQPTARLNPIEVAVDVSLSSTDG